MGEEKLQIEKAMRVFMKIKAERTELSAKFKAKDGDLKEKQDRIKTALLDYCRENELDSVRTASGMFYRSVKTKYWTSDWESMYDFILENRVPEFFAKSLNQGNVQEFLEENPDVMPKGLNISSEYVLTIRK